MKMQIDTVGLIYLCSLQSFLRLQRLDFGTRSTQSFTFHFCVYHWKALEGACFRILALNNLLVSSSH